MANKFKIKRSSVAGRSPSAADLEVGELAINLTDGRLFTKDGSNAVIDVVGQNVNTSSNVVFNKVTVNSLSVNTGVVANGSVGANGQTLTSDGSGVYWNHADRLYSSNGSVWTIELRDLVNTNTTPNWHSASLVIPAAQAGGNSFQIVADEQENISIGYGAGFGMWGNGDGNNMPTQRSVAIGWNVATGNTQGSHAIAIGSDDVGYEQADGSIAIGQAAGWADNTAIGIDSIAIGHNACYTDGKDNSIVLNATGLDLSPYNSGLYIKPIRQDAAISTYSLDYDPVSGEIVYNTKSAGGFTNGQSISVSNIEVTNTATLAKISANGSLGTAGQVLTSNGVGTYWSSVSGGGGGSFIIAQSNSSANVETYASITTLQFDEDSGFDVTNPEPGVARIAMNSTFKYWEVNGVQQLTATGLDTVNFKSGNNIVISANGLASPQELTIGIEAAPSFARVDTYLETISGTGSIVVHDLETSSLFYHDSPTSDFTVNFTNGPSTNQSTVARLLIVQGNTPYLPTAVQMDGVDVEIAWRGDTIQPLVGSSDQTDMVTFELIRLTTNWIVLAKLETWPSLLQVPVGDYEITNKVFDLHTQTAPTRDLNS